MKEIQFQVREKPLDQGEINRLKTLQFKFSPPGSAELAEAFKMVLGGLIAAVVGYFFGGWVIKNFVGPGVIIFGYGFKYLLPPVGVIVAIVSICSLFRPSHKKKAADAMKWMWKVSIMGEDATGARFGKLSYAKETMTRLLPVGTGFHPDQFGGYVMRVREEMNKAADVEGEKLKKEGWTQSHPYTELTVSEEREIQPDLHELHATLSFHDKYAQNANNKTVYIVGNQMKLDIIQTFVCAGKYWFPYDTMPSFVQTSAPQGTEESGADTTNNS